MCPVSCSPSWKCWIQKSEYISYNLKFVFVFFLRILLLSDSKVFVLYFSPVLNVSRNKLLCWYICYSLCSTQILIWCKHSVFSLWVWIIYYVIENIIDNIEEVKIILPKELLPINISHVHSWNCQRATAYIQYSDIKIMESNIFLQNKSISDL